MHIMKKCIPLYLYYSIDVFPQCTVSNVNLVPARSDVFFDRSAAHVSFLEAIVPVRCEEVVKQLIWSMTGSITGSIP